MSRRTYISKNSWKLLLSAGAIVTLGIASINAKPALAYTTSSSHLSAKAASKTLVLKAGSEKEGGSIAPEILDATVKVYYQDRTGKILAPTKVISGNPGERYTTSPMNVSGYTLSSEPANATGLFASTPQDVIYTYDITGSFADHDLIAIGINKGDPVDTVSGSAGIENSNATENANSKNESAAGTTSQLPQTGMAEKSKSAMLGLGFLSLFGGLIGTCFSRKRRD